MDSITVDDWTFFQAPIGDGRPALFALSLG